MDIHGSNARVVSSKCPSETVNLIMFLAKISEPGQLECRTSANVFIILEAAVLSAVMCLQIAHVVSSMSPEGAGVQYQMFHPSLQ